MAITCCMALVPRPSPVRWRRWAWPSGARAGCPGRTGRVGASRAGTSEPASSSRCCLAERAGFAIGGHHWPRRLLRRAAPRRLHQPDHAVTGGECGVGGLAVCSRACSNYPMDVQRPRWWTYPIECANGHPWGPGQVRVSWRPCQCAPARAVQPRGSGHRVIACGVPGCRSVFFEPPHDPATALTRPSGSRVAQPEQDAADQHGTPPRQRARRAPLARSGPAGAGHPIANPARSTRCCRAGLAGSLVPARLAATRPVLPGQPARAPEGQAHRRHRTGEGRGTKAKQHVIAITGQRCSPATRCRST